MYTEYKAMHMQSNQYGADILMDMLKEGWSVVDKLPYNANEGYTVYQWYIFGRNEASKQLYEKSSK
jgi:hypothetical protein